MTDLKKITRNRPKTNWVYWGCRINEQMSNELMELAKLLKEKGYIAELNKYEIVRFAVISMHKTLKKQAQPPTK